MQPITSFTGAYRFLSNFYSCRYGIVLDGDKYPTVEHAYQAAKTTDAKDRDYIRGMQKPGQAKRFGRQVSLRPNWEQIRLDVMLCLVRQKFEADAALAADLLATKDAELIECNDWGDTYWGQCWGAGQNHLGRILMQVRSELATKRYLP